MKDIYTILIVGTSIVLAVITAIRIAYILGKRWRLNDDPTIFLCIGAAISSGVIVGVTDFALIVFGGHIYGLFGALLSVPAVGAASLFIVGANKAIERILSNLLSKVS